MKSTYLLHHLIFQSAKIFPQNIALTFEDQNLHYFELKKSCLDFASAIVNLKISKQERLAVFLEKRFEFVISCFGASAAGNIFVPINPILKADQALHILIDSGAKILITTSERFSFFKVGDLEKTSLQHIIILDSKNTSSQIANFISESHSSVTHPQRPQIWFWSDFIKSAQPQNFLADDIEFSLRPSVDTEAVSILYTSGSTGRPKGVVLSHRNMVFGAKNVASYLENKSTDSLLAALPLSFDAGFSQLTTAFHVGGRAVLINYLVPKDVLTTVAKERITGMTAVPPLWMQIVNLKWPASVNEHLRYFANTGGRMPFEILKKLRENFPAAKPYLMYGLTESFRSTFLPPEEVDRRPDSIGKAIPNAEVLVLKADGSPCGADEPGELVHRGSLVGLGYWNDPEKTAERYKQLPQASHCRPTEIIIPEYAVFSGDIVRRDSEGYFYFIGRNDEMIKTSGYRVSPVEIEEVVFNSGLALEVGAFGVPHPSLGQVIIASVVLNESSEMSPAEAVQKILAYCREKVPAYMVPQEILIQTDAHPRNQNGKIDRKKLAQEYSDKKEKTVAVS